MKTSFAALAALLCAALPAQAVIWPTTHYTRGGSYSLRWHDVYIVNTSIVPIAVGNELGLVVFNNLGLTFTFHNWTSQRLRVHAVGWNGTGPAQLEGRQVCNYTYRTAYPFGVSQMGGIGWMPTNFVIGQVDLGLVCTPTTMWHFQGQHAFGWGANVPHAFVVTAVGGW